MLSKIIHETKTKGNILKILLTASLHAHCRPAFWTGLDLKSAFGWAQISALACPSPPQMPMPPVLRVWHLWWDTLRHTLGSSCFMPDWSKYSTLILVLPNWLSSPQDSNKHSQNIYLFDAMWFSTDCRKIGFSVRLSRTKVSADNIYLKIAPAAPHHDPPFRQLSLGCGCPVTHPALTGERALLAHSSSGSVAITCTQHKTWTLVNQDRVQDCWFSSVTASLGSWQ